MNIRSESQTALDVAYCNGETDMPLAPKIAVLGGGATGLDFVWQMIKHVEGKGGKISGSDIIVIEGGPFDLTNHMGNSGLPRIRLEIAGGLQRLGGRSPMWGLWSPRPDDARLREWPFDFDDLNDRFARQERTMGIKEPIPLSGRRIDQVVTARLRSEFSSSENVRNLGPGPLAIDASGHRWSSVDYLADILERGTTIATHANVDRLETDGQRILAIHGTRHGKIFTLRPSVTVCAVGVERALSLLADALSPSTDWQPTDHIRIDASGWLPADSFGCSDAESLGVSAVLLGLRSRESDAHYHLQIKTAPKCFWSRYMPGGDNLQSSPYDSRILLQIQGVGQLNDRLCCSNLVRDNRRIHAAVSLRDMRLHTEIAEVMDSVAGMVGCKERRCEIRHMTFNHHLHGLLRINRGVTRRLQVEGLDNFYVLAPVAYPDCDDDANPILKSLAINTYAAEAVAEVAAL